MIPLISSSEGQLIIVENTNELPKLNYAEHGVHEIVFTHDENKGRYGFLLDIESRWFYEI